MWNIEDKQGFETESSFDRGQINIESDFGRVIYELAKKEENSVFVDIGTWNGLGSTKCFIEAMLFNKKSTLLSIENNIEKFEFAKNKWTNFIQNNNLNVRFINGSLIKNENVDNWIISNDINLSEEQKYWITIDKSNTQNIIEIDTEKIDILLIDGSEFTGYLEMMMLKDISNYILLDDVNSLKNKMSRDYLMQCDDFQLVFEDLNSRGGYSVFKKK